MINIKKEAKYLVVCWASLHKKLLARQLDLVVPGKRAVIIIPAQISKFCSVS
jgi:hypothetical protein